MAEIPSTIQAQSGNEASSAPQSPAAQTTEGPNLGAMRFSRRDFFIDTGTYGDRVNRRTGRPVESDRGPEVEISAETRQQFANFLQNHAEIFERLREQRDPANPRQTLYDAIASTANHQLDTRLLQFLERDAREPNGELNKQKLSANINRFLSTSRGLIVTDLVMQQQTETELSALGISMASLPVGERVGVAEALTVRFPQNEGPLPEPLRRLRETWGRVRNGVIATTGVFGLGAGVGAAGGALRGDVLGGMEVGVAGAGIVSAIGYLRHLARPGDTWEIRHSMNKLRAITADRAEADYVQATLGINVHNYRVVGGEIVLAPGATQIADVRERSGQVVEKALTHQRFMEELGADPSRMDAVGEQFIIDYVDAQPQQTNAWFDQRVHGAFIASGGVRDAVGLIPGQPGFRIEQVLPRFHDARRRVAGEVLEDFIRKELGRGRDSNRVQTRREGQIAARGEEGTIVARRKSEISAEKDRLTRIKTTIDGEKTSVENYRTKYQELQRVQAGLSRELATLVRGGAGFGTDHAAAITALRQVLTDAGAAAHIAINGRRINSINDRSEVNENRRAVDSDAVPGAHPPNVGENAISYERRLKPFYDAIDARYQREQVRIDADVAAINAEITRIENLAVDIQRVQTELSESAEVVRELNQLTAKWNADFTAITGWNGPPPGVGLTEADLRTQTIAVIQSRINAAYAADVAAGVAPPRGWPEDQNNRLDFQVRIHDAMGEAAARAQEAADPRRAQYAVLTSPPWNFTENQLRSRDIADLMVDIAGRGIPGPPTIAQVQNAIGHAQRRLEIRASLLDQASKITQTQIDNQDNLLASVAVDRMSREETEFLQMVTALEKRQEEIFNAAYSELTDDPDRFTNATPVAAADVNYTQAERDLHTAAGYYELMDVLFDYQTPEQSRGGREALFRVVSRELPPMELAQRLNDSLGLALTPARARNIGTVLTTMRTQLHAGAIRGPQLQQALRDIINRFERRANAIT